MLSCCYQRRLPQRPPAVWNRRNTCRPSSAPSPSTSNPTAATRSPTVPSSACPQVLQRYQVHPPLNAWFFLCRLVFAPLCVLRGSYLLLVSSWLHKMLFMFWADLQRNWSTIVWLYKESRTWRGHLPSISLLALTALHSRIADGSDHTDPAPSAMLCRHHSFFIYPHLLGKRQPSLTSKRQNLVLMIVLHGSFKSSQFKTDLQSWYSERDSEVQWNWLRRDWTRIWLSIVASSKHLSPVSKKCMF